MERTIDRSLYLLLIIFLALILLGLFLQDVVQAQEYDYGDILTPEEQKLAADIEAEYLAPGGGEVIRFLGDGKVDRGDTVEGSVIVVKGTLVVEGRVTGHVIALFADLELTSHASVGGDVVCVDGKIWRQKGATIHGDVTERASDLPKDRSRRNGVSRHGKTFKNWENGWNHGGQDEEEGIWADYNRVYGLTLGLNIPRQSWRDHRQSNYGLYGKAGYGFAAKRAQYQLGLQRWIFRKNHVTLGGEFHDLCDTEDQWIISSLENALAAGLLREDFRDYYRREGFSLYAGQNIGHFMNLQAEYHSDEISNLEKETNWSLFGGKKKFRSNPEALPGAWGDQKPVVSRNLTSVVGRVELDTRDQSDTPRRGWWIQAMGEGGRFAEDDAEKFERYIVDLRRYQPTGWGENINIRLRAGSARGVLPPMYWFDLGGLSTLRGYRFKEFTGDRMVLANVEYRLHPTPIDWLFFDEFNLILFVDSGYAWFANGEYPDSLSHWPVSAAISERSRDEGIEDEFSNLTWSKLKTDVGVGIETEDGDFRVDFARRTDRSGGDLVISFRLRHSF